MPIQEHVESLRAKHAKLEEMIADELHRPLPDQTALAQLKKEKLKIKEQIELSSSPDRDVAERVTH